MTGGPHREVREELSEEITIMFRPNWPEGAGPTDNGEKGVLGG